MRAAREALGTLVVGALLGYLAASLTSAALGDRATGTTESPKARAFMVGLLEHDPDALIALRPSQDVASRASQFQSAASAHGSVTPLSLTFIGGGSLGRLEVDIYAVEFRANNQTQFWPIALILADGKVLERR